MCHSNFKLANIESFQPKNRGRKSRDTVHCEDIFVLKAEIHTLFLEPNFRIISPNPIKTLKHFIDEKPRF